MSMIENEFLQYKSAMQDMQAAERRAQQALERLKNAGDKSTFDIDGKYFQIRSRTKEGKTVYYLCKLNGPPKGRPKKNNE